MTHMSFHFQVCKGEDLSGRSPMVGPLTGHKFALFSTFSVRFVKASLLFLCRTRRQRFHQKAPLPVPAGQVKFPIQECACETSGIYLHCIVHMVWSCIIMVSSLNHSHVVVCHRWGRLMDGKLINVAVGGTGSFWFLTLSTGRQRRIYHNLYKFQVLICPSHVSIFEQSRENFYSTILGALWLWSFQLLIPPATQLFARFRVMATALSIRSRPEVIERVRWSNIRVLWLWYLDAVWYCINIIIVYLLFYCYYWYLYSTWHISRCVEWGTPWTCAICYVQRCSSCQSNLFLNY